MNKIISKAELDANKSIGWYVNRGGKVYQVITITPRKVRYMGILEAQSQGGSE